MEGGEARVTTGQTRKDGNGGPAQVPDRTCRQNDDNNNNIPIRRVAHSPDGVAASTVVV